MPLTDRITTTTKSPVSEGYFLQNCQPGKSYRTPNITDLQTIASALGNPPETDNKALLLKTTLNGFVEAKKSSDTHLDTVSLLAIFHSTGRCYTQDLEEKSNDLSHLVDAVHSNWTGETGLLIH